MQKKRRTWKTSSNTAEVCQEWRTWIKLCTGLKVAVFAVVLCWELLTSYLKEMLQITLRQLLLLLVINRNIKVRSSGSCLRSSNRFLQNDDLKKISYTALWCKLPSTRVKHGWCCIMNMLHFSLCLIFYGPKVTNKNATNFSTELQYLLFLVTKRYIIVD